MAPTNCAARRSTRSLDRQNRSRPVAVVNPVPYRAPFVFPSRLCRAHVRNECSAERMLLLKNDGDIPAVLCGGRPDGNGHKRVDNSTPIAIAVAVAAAIVGTPIAVSASVVAAPDGRRP